MSNKCKWLCVALFFCVLIGCSNQNNEKDSLLQMITDLKYEVNDLKINLKSLENENSKLTISVQTYENKIKNKVLNPDVQYSSLMFNNMPTYVGIDGYISILGGKKNLVTFYADGRGLVFSPLATDTTAGTMFVPHEFRFLKEEKNFSLCVDAEIELNVFEERCFQFEYKIDDTAKTLTLYNEKEKAVFQQYHNFTYLAGSDS